MSGIKQDDLCPEWQSQTELSMKPAVGTEPVVIRTSSAGRQKKAEVRAEQAMDRCSRALDHAFNAVQPALLSQFNHE